MKHSPPPSFNIAIRFGSLNSEEPFDFRLMDREISSDGVMTSSWGSRGYGSPHMDEWFDEPGPRPTAIVPTSGSERTNSYPCSLKGL